MMDNEEWRMERSIKERLIALEHKIKRLEGYETQVPKGKEDAFIGFSIGYGRINTPYDEQELIDAGYLEWVKNEEVEVNSETTVLCKGCGLEPAEETYQYCDECQSSALELHFIRNTQRIYGRLEGSDG